MKELKQGEKMPRHISQQIFNNFHKKPIMVPHTIEGAKKNAKDNIVSYLANGFTYTTKSPDNICCINKEYITITHIFENGVITGYKFLNLKRFFKVPIDSVDVGIVYVKNLNAHSSEDIFSLKDALQIQFLPYKERAVLIPLIN